MNLDSNRFLYLKNLIDFKLCVIWHLIPIIYCYCYDFSIHGNLVVNIITIIIYMPLTMYNNIACLFSIVWFFDLLSRSLLPLQSMLYINYLCFVILVP